MRNPPSPEGQHGVHIALRGGMYAYVISMLPALITMAGSMTQAGEAVNPARATVTR